MPEPAVMRQMLGGLRRAEEDLHACARLVERQLELLSEHRQALITAAVTGEHLASSGQRTSGAA